MQSNIVQKMDRYLQTSSVKYKRKASIGTYIVKFSVRGVSHVDVMH